MSLEVGTEWNTGWGRGTAQDGTGRGRLGGYKGEKRREPGRKREKKEKNLGRIKSQRGGLGFVLESVHSYEDAGEPEERVLMKKPLFGYKVWSTEYSEQDYDWKSTSTSAMFVNAILCIA